MMRKFIKGPKEESRDPYENGSDGNKSNQLNKPPYSIGLERIMEKGKIMNPFSIGPACIALPDGMYTQDEPLDMEFMSYKNSRLDAYIDKLWCLGAGFTIWSDVGFKIKKDENYWIPNLMTAIKVMPDIQLGNWINPPPLWSNIIGYDVKIRTGDTLRVELYNESGSMGYIWLFIVGHYELMEEGEI